MLLERLQWRQRFVEGPAAVDRLGHVGAVGKVDGDEALTWRHRRARLARDDAGQ